MRLFVPVALVLMAFSALAIAQPAAPTAAGSQVKGKEDRFTITVPPGWQSIAYNKPEDKPNARIIFQAGLLGENAKPTDNFNLWWYQGPDNMIMGVASFHRLELERETDLKTLLALIQASGKLPQGMEVKPTQLGKYVGLLGGGVVQGMFYAAVALIPQGKVMYAATIVGPQTAIPPQWPAFMRVVTSLEATDLEPATLEEVMAAPAGKQEPADDETPAEGKDDDAE